jgi:hypothetical protein
MPQSQDHDLLVELRTEMRGVRDDIKEIKDGTAAQLLDHETRVRALEKQSERWFGKQSAIATTIASAIALIAAYISSGRI